MKILYFFPYDGTFMTEWQRVQIFDEMSHYDVHFEIFNPLEFESYNQANEELLKRLKNDSSIDLFLNCASSDMLYPDTMKEISSLPIAKLLICFDNLHAPFMHKSIAPYFDLVWLTSKETEHMFKCWGCKSVFLPYAANPYLYTDRYSCNIERVAFVGTPYGTRSLIINKLLDNRVPCDVFCNKGRGVKSSIKNPLWIRLRNVSRFSRFPIGRKLLYSKLKCHFSDISLDENNSFLTLYDSLTFEAMNGVYSDYALSLNIIDLLSTAILSKSIQKLHLRTFEIPMCAGLELVSYNEELAEYFTDEEMVFYSSTEEMGDKAKFYTDPRNSSICRSMKLRARDKAVKEHCWKKRFDVVFKELGCKYPIQ